MYNTEQLEYRNIERSGLFQYRHISALLNLGITMPHYYSDAQITIPVLTITQMLRLLYLTITQMLTITQRLGITIPHYYSDAQMLGIATPHYCSDGGGGGGEGGDQVQPRLAAPAPLPPKIHSCHILPFQPIV